MFMNKYIFFAVVALVFYACQKEEVNSQQFVTNHFIGKWPLKKAIFKTTKNGIVTANDTLIYGLDSPAIVRRVDTVRFTDDGKCIKRGQALSYSIDANGDNLTYSSDSIGTWNIKFLRLKSIILTQEKTEKKGSDTFIYFKEEQLIK